MTINQITANAHGFRVDAKSMKIGGALLGVGGAICLVGVAISGAALLDAARRWIDELEQPPSVIARNTWAQAKAATAAGMRAWQEQNGAQQAPLAASRR